MTAHFDPTAHIHKHATISTADGLALFGEFFKKLPSNGLDGLSRVDRLEKMVSILVTAHAEQAVVVSKLEENVLAQTQTLELLGMALAAMAQESEVRFEAAANALMVLGRNVFNVDPSPAQPEPAEDAEGPLVLRFPHGDTNIVHEQGLVGFRLMASNTVSAVTMLEYLDDVVIGLFEQGLVSDELSDDYLDISLAIRTGQMIDTAKVARIGNSAEWNSEMDAGLAQWHASKDEGVFAFRASDIKDVEGVLLAAVWRILFNTLAAGGKTRAA